MVKNIFTVYLLVFQNIFNILQLKTIWSKHHLGGAEVKFQTITVGPKDWGENPNAIEYIGCAIDLPKG